VLSRAAGELLTATYLTPPNHVTDKRLQGGRWAVQPWKCADRHTGGKFRKRRTRLRRRRQHDYRTRKRRPEIALDALNQRYALGDIGRTEYLQNRNDILAALMWKAFIDRWQRKRMSHLVDVCCTQHEGIREFCPHNLHRNR
jgi:hypothetical protein